MGGERQTPFVKGWNAYEDHGDFSRNPYKTRAARVRWCAGFKAARLRDPRLFDRTTQPTGASNE